MRTRNVVLLSACAALACATSSDRAEPARAAERCSARVELSTIWRHLEGKYDVDRDGRVTLDEYDRGDVRFANYDRNTDGVLSEDDFPTDRFFNGFAHRFVRDADADGDGEVTRTEWTTFTEAFDLDGDGRIERHEVREAMRQLTKDWELFLVGFDNDFDGDFDEADLQVMFRDLDFDGNGALAGKELEGWQSTAPRSDGEPPAAGEPAPDFELAYAGEPDRTFRLSEACRERPVALVFGSYT